MIEDGKFDALRAERYAGWDKPEAKAMLAKGATLELIAARVAKEKIEPKPKSGRQEFYENLLNRYL